jgi:hypothetical protein
MTGMLIFGKISVGVPNTERTPKIAIRIAMTTKVYGRESASRTIAVKNRNLEFEDRTVNAHDDTSKRAARRCSNSRVRAKVQA